MYAIESDYFRRRPRTRPSSSIKFWFTRTSTRTRTSTSTKSIRFDRLKALLFETIKFLLRSDWTLAARGGAYMKLRLAWTVNRLNVEHRTSNIERPILMALRFIYFKTSEPQNTEQQPATSSPRRARAWACRKQPNRISKDSIAALCLYFKLAEYIIRCWTFNVRCSMFIF